MNQLQLVEQKTVRFDGDEIVVVKANNEKIYAAVKWVCQGMQLTEGQYQNQTRKLSDDPVLVQGIAKMQLPTNSGVQDVLCIDLEFMPLWLAKINAGIISDEVIRNKVVSYQLKAKDVLTKAFMPSENVVPMSKDQALVTVLRTTADLVEDTQAIKEEQHEIRKLVTQIDQKVEEQITLTSGEQRRLQKAVASKVYELCDDPAERPSLFREIYREIKDRFAVASYKDVKQRELQSAIRYVENWIPRRVS
ncbi:phage antirepressor N-terminal domain-containing protein [Bacillus badius]|uniref:Antirepressor protein ant n=1 Tax=Bacillus badius TaxID=1455 RepID=A0ABR5B144_BACBA|nr:phage antirepressor N-terminal domain-containing protein [Bacillus badius]KIL80698.1 Antirepressor protein ant [Bacillus badius]MED4715373.1 phage antirepressor N-terminal domain-containing protein [Bacillus badius]